MIDAFWEKLGEGLAGQWNARALTPAFAFWGGALLAWAYRHGWDKLIQLLQSLDAVAGAALLIAGVFLLAVSIGLVHWLALPALRLAEGYWPRPLGWLGELLVRRVNRVYLKRRLELEKLAKKYQADALDRRGSQRYARLDFKLDHLPVDARLRLPTRLGNTLRAAEEYPALHYGLEISVAWPRLWLVLPESAQTELAAARQALNEGVQLLVWGLAFLAWSVWAWWAFIPALGVILAAWLRLPAAALVYAQLLRAAFDLHRFHLYDALSWPRPTHPALEKAHGEALTQHLKRHLADPQAQFAAPEKE